jgi:RimJ/RimL family protein N-acetyltransferase
MSRARSVETCAFETARLTVRPWHDLTGHANAPADLAPIVAAMMTPAVSASLPDEWHGPFTVGRAQRWIEQRDKEGTTLLALDRTSGHAVGLLILHELAADAGSGVDLRLGYLIAEADWGRRLGRELVSGFVGWCRGQPWIRSIAGGVDADNVASIRILEANGFVRERRQADRDRTLVYRLDLGS